MKWKTAILSDISTNIQTGPFGSQLHQSDYSIEGTPVVMPKAHLPQRKKQVGFVEQAVCVFQQMSVKQIRNLFFTNCKSRIRLDGLKNTLLEQQCSI